MKLVTIIIRTHNQEGLVSKAIKSVLNQTLSRDKFDILVVNDSSTDNTSKILERHKKDIIVMNVNNKNYVKTLNDGIRNTKTDFLILLDGDDTFEPSILEKMFNVIENDENVSFVYSDYYETDEKGNKKIVNTDNILNCLAGGIMFKKQIFDDLGYYDENLVFPEYDLLIKLKQKYKGRRIHEPLFNYFRHSKSITADKDLVERGKKQLFKKYGEIKELRDY
ncbi:MAG: glycosyltransferase family 2 protein [Candidatus Woesearchaeota archaeon]|nr:MAG: glycosyltransferase family 2 protein [Candidatus Woesearchaeota archaeon]